MKFNIFKAMKNPESIDACFAVNIIQGDVAKGLESLQSPVILEQALNSNNSSEDDEELADIITLFDVQTTTRIVIK